MSKFLKRTMIAGAGTLAIVVPFFAVEGGSANVDSTVQQVVPHVQQITEQAMHLVNGGHCQPLGPHGGVACYPW